MSDRIWARNSEQPSFRLLNEHERDSLPFTVDVKDVVNKTDLKLPEKGKLILASLNCISSDEYIVHIEQNNLKLCCTIDVTHVDFTCVWKVLMVETYL